MNARIASATLLASFAALASGAAQATATTQYMCKGYRPLAVELTPQEAQVHFEGNDYALKRVHDNGEARYVSARDGVTVITKGRELSILHHSERLTCKLVSDALGAPKPPPAAPSAVLSTSAPVASK